jgi:hypothetical protein
MWHLNIDGRRVNTIALQPYSSPTGDRDCHDRWHSCRARGKGGDREQRRERKVQRFKSAASAQRFLLSLTTPSMFSVASSSVARSRPSGPKP